MAAETFTLGMEIQIPYIDLSDIPSWIYNAPTSINIEISDIACDYLGSVSYEQQEIRPANIAIIRATVEVTTERTNVPFAAQAIVTAYSHEESENPPYVVYDSGLTVVYKSPKTESEIESNRICPICYSKILNQDGSGSQTWLNDPILTPKGLAGIRFTGFQRIRKTDISALQGVRGDDEVAAGVPEEDRIDFSNLSSTGYFQVKKEYITEIRDSIENSLEASGLTKDEFFNYNEDGVDMDSSQSDWHNTNLDIFQGNIKALHIEDLRHYMATASGEFLLFYGTGYDTVRICEESNGNTNLVDQPTATLDVSSYCEKGDIIYTENYIFTIYGLVISKYDLSYNLLSTRTMSSAMTSARILTDNSYVYVVGYSRDGGNEEDYVWLYKLNFDLENVQYKKITVDSSYQEIVENVSKSTRVHNSIITCLDKGYLYFEVEDYLRVDDPTKETSSYTNIPIWMYKSIFGGWWFYKLASALMFSSWVGFVPSPNLQVLSYGTLTGDSYMATAKVRPHEGRTLGNSNIHYPREEVRHYLYRYSLEDFTAGSVLTLTTQTTTSYNDYLARWPLDSNYTCGYFQVKNIECDNNYIYCFLDEQETEITSGDIKVVNYNSAVWIYEKDGTPYKRIALAGNSAVMTKLDTDGHVETYTFDGITYENEYDIGNMFTSKNITMSENRIFMNCELDIDSDIIEGARGNGEDLAYLVAGDFVTYPEQIDLPASWVEWYVMKKGYYMSCLKADFLASTEDYILDASFITNITMPSDSLTVEDDEGDYYYDGWNNVIGGFLAIYNLPPNA